MQNFRLTFAYFATRQNYLRSPRVIIDLRWHKGNMKFRVTKFFRVQFWLCDNVTSSTQRALESSCPTLDFRTSEVFPFCQSVATIEARAAIFIGHTAGNWAHAFPIHFSDFVTQITFEKKM
jgi:hypothetical protein